jgi:hypothetical protein
MPNWREGGTVESGEGVVQNFKEWERRRGRKIMWKGGATK